LLYLCHQDLLSFHAHTKVVSYSDGFVGNALRSLAFRPDVAQLITHGADGWLKVWDGVDGHPVFSFGGPTNRVLSWATTAVRSELETEIVYGRHVRDWWLSHDPNSHTDPGVVVWTGKHANTRMYATSLRLYKSTWENPQPNIEVPRIDLVSKLTFAEPFVVAMTVGD